MASVTNLPLGGRNSEKEGWGRDTSTNGRMVRRHVSGRLVVETMEPEPAHSDPYLAVRKMLWLLPGINDLVRNAVDRIQRVCAYNSVYFLKVVLDLQWTYLALQPLPPQDVILEKEYVFRIAEFMATRMARRETEPGSLSRELQLRTLTSALMLLHRHEVGNLDDDTYARLLHSVSERDSDNELRYANGEDLAEFMAEGDIEYLALYACDLMRSMPPNELDSEVQAEFHSGTGHFLVAAGAINDIPPDNQEWLYYIFNRLKQPPTTSFKELFYLNMHVSNALALLQQRVKIEGQTPGSHAIEIATRVFDRIEKEVNFLKTNRHTQLLELLSDGVSSPSGSQLTMRERQLYVCALLDLASTLVAAFNNTESIVDHAKEMAEALITDSDVKKFRFKAFEILFSTTIGSPVSEYRRLVDRLDGFISSLCETNGTFGPQSEEDRGYAMRRVQELHVEKKKAVERFERRMNLYKGAKASLERRLEEQESRLGRQSHEDFHGHADTPSDSYPEDFRTTPSPAPSLSLTAESPIQQPLANHDDSDEPLSRRGTDKAQRVLGLTDMDDARLRMFIADAADPEEEDILGSEENTLKAPKRPDFDEERPMSFATGNDVLHVTARLEKLGMTRKPSDDEMPVGDEVGAEMDQLGSELGTRFEGHLSESDAESEPNMEANVLYIVDEKFTVAESIKTPSSSPEMNGYDLYDEKIVVESYYPESHAGSSSQTADSSRRPSRLSLALPIQGKTPLSMSRQESQEFDLPIQSPDEHSAPLESPWNSLFIKGRSKWTKRRKGCKKDSVTGSEDGSERGLKTKKSHSKDQLRREETIRVFLDRNDRNLTRTPNTIEERDADFEYAGSNRAFSPDYKSPVRSGTSNSTRPIDILPGPKGSQSDFSAQHSPTDRHLGEQYSESEGFRSQDEFTPASSSPSKFQGSVNLLQAHGSVSDTPETHYRRRNYSPSVLTPDGLNKALPAPSESGDEGYFRKKPKRKSSFIAESAPELVEHLQQPHQFRSRIGQELMSEKKALLMRQHADARSTTADAHPYRSPSETSRVVERPANVRKPVYETIAATNCYKLSPKDSSFTNFISTDAKNIIFMQEQSFEVFATPIPREVSAGKAKFAYKLGSTEGHRKKRTVPWKYVGGVASTRYIATITEHRVQVHDLTQSCKVVYTDDKEETWIYTCVAIAADRLVVGMSHAVGVANEHLGALRVYKMTGADFSGPKWEREKEIRLPITIQKPQDAPHNVHITHDGLAITCCTPIHGYFFSWDITLMMPGMEPTLISNGRLSVTVGQHAEALTSAMLFPNKQHILCSTVTRTSGQSDHQWGGCFIEPTSFTEGEPPHHPIRQVGLRVHHTVISKDGNACAFLTRTGTIYVVPVMRIGQDKNLTSLGASHPNEKLKNSTSPDQTGSLRFTEKGDRLIAVDRSGKVIVLTFETQPAT